MAEVNASYMIDKSALARMTSPPVAKRISPLIEAGEVATCAIIELEVLYSAREFDTLKQTRQRRELAYEKVELTDSIFEDALNIQMELAKEGHHRIPIPDLIVAATANSESLKLLHYDKDFDLIANVTDQTTEWVVPQGTL